MIAPRHWRTPLMRANRRLFDRLGVVGLIGGGLVVLAVALALYAIPLERSTEDVRVTADETRARLDVARQRHMARNSPQQAAQMQQWVPPIDHLNADVRRVFDAAEKSRVAIPKGEYSFAAADGSPLRRFEIVLPVKERYGTIKVFVAEVLNTLPHASLSELRVERSAVNVDVLEARIRFTLFYRTS